MLCHVKCSVLSLSTQYAQGYFALSINDVEIYWPPIHTHIPLMLHHFIRFIDVCVTTPPYPSLAAHEISSRQAST